MKAFISSCFLFLSFLLQPTQSHAYGVLAHQALLDASWDSYIEPMLRHQYPNATEEQLTEAHAYAYGGSVIHDMGYFPTGTRFYSDLVHYVRTGDFVEALFEEAQNLNEFAFAVGAMAHYYSDVYGHLAGINRAVPIIYPEMCCDHGHSVTYADDPLTHMKTELAFDIIQLARGTYPPETYRSYVGFKIAEESWERAFRKTYGLELRKQFFSKRLTVTVYRKTIKSLFPSLARISWKMKDVESIEESESQQDPEKRRAIVEHRPNSVERLLGFSLRLAPKLGPLAPLDFKQPTPDAELLFNSSYATAVDQLQAALQERQQNRLRLPNRGLDNGLRTKPGMYALTDETYDELLEELSDNKHQHLNRELKQELLDFYTHPDAAKLHNEDEKEVTERLENLNRLKQAKPAASN